MAYREENGRFSNRKELLKVSKLGPKAFEQCAGFMRIMNGDNPLDATSVHPESYAATEILLKETGHELSEINGLGLKNFSKEVKDYKKLSETAGVGDNTGIEAIGNLRGHSYRHFQQEAVDDFAGSGGFVV